MIGIGKNPHVFRDRVRNWRAYNRAPILCASERDAQRIRAILPKRCARYGLQLRPDKTRVIRFTRPPYPDQERRHQQAGWPETFEFLGCTHSWGRCRHGNWVVKRKTAAARFSRSLRRIKEWCRKHRHHKVAWQHQQLVTRVRGVGAPSLVHS